MEKVSNRKERKVQTEKRGKRKPKSREREMLTVKRKAEMRLEGGKKQKNL